MLTRKQIPLLALISKEGNDKHNPGEPLHHARGKSMDHGDCLLRHLMDLQDHLAAGRIEEAVKLGGRWLCRRSDRSPSLAALRIQISLFCDIRETFGNVRQSL